MSILRTFGLVALIMASPMGQATDCYYPGTGDDDPNTSDGQFCPPGAPAADCPCAVAGELGCTDDGLTHDEAFVCEDGVWVDIYDTADADAAFCGHPDLVYNFCAYIEGEVWTNCTMAE